MTKLNKKLFNRNNGVQFKESLRLISSNEIEGHATPDQRPSRSHWFSPIQKFHQYLVICESFEDTKTINANYSLDTELVAICLEGFAHVPSNVLSAYRKQFGQNIFVLFPQHKASDGKRLSEVQKLNHIDLARALSFQRSYTKNTNTLSETFEVYGDNFVTETLVFALDTCWHVPQYLDDPDSIGITEAYKVDFENYVSEASETLEKLLVKHDKLILQSGAGTGKSTYLIKLAESQLHEVVLNCSHLVIVEPKTSIAEQLYNDFHKKLLSEESEYSEGDLALVSGAMCEAELGALPSAKIVICVLDSLPKISTILDTCFLVVDEYHEISKDQNYRGKPMRVLWKSMQLAKRKLLLSATPDYMLATNLIPDFNYKLVVGRSEAPNKFNLVFKKHKCPKRQLLPYIEDHAPQKGGTICTKYDNDSTLLTFQEYLEARFVDSEYNTSKRKENKSESLTYNSIMKSGKLDRPLRFLLFTALYESGVSFKFPIDLMTIFDSLSWQAITQTATRARYNEREGLNMENEVWVFISNNRKEPAKNSTRIEQRFLDYYDSARALARRMDGLESGGKTKFKTNTDIKHFVYEVQKVCEVTNALTTRHEIDIPAILHRVYQESVNNSSLELLQKRITRFDSRFTCSVESVEVEVCEEIESMLDEVKASREESEQDFLGLLKSDFDAVANATCYLSKNLEFRENTKRSLRLGMSNREASKDLIKANPKAFSYDHKANTLRSISALVEGGMSKSKAVEKVCALNKEDLKTCVTATTLRRRHTQYAQAPESLSANDKYQTKIDKAIFRKVDKLRKNAKAGKYKNGLTKSDLCEVINRAILEVHKTKKKSLNQTKALAKLKALYEVEQVRKTIDGKRVWRYEIRGRKFNLNRGKN